MMTPNLVGVAGRDLGSRRQLPRVRGQSCRVVGDGADGWLKTRVWACDVVYAPTYYGQSRQHTTTGTDTGASLSIDPWCAA